MANMPGTSDGGSAATPPMTHADTSLDTHDAGYAAQRPDGGSRALQGGHDMSGYTKVDGNDLVHFSDLTMATVDPLLVRARHEIDAIPTIHAGDFPHGQELARSVSELKAQYSLKLEHLQNIVRGTCTTLHQSGGKYNSTEQASTMHASEVNGGLSPVNAELSSMGSSDIPWHDPAAGSSTS
jgi:hypothetical protein